MKLLKVNKPLEGVIFLVRCLMLFPIFRKLKFAVDELVEKGFSVDADMKLLKVTEVTATPDVDKFIKLALADLEVKVRRKKEEALRLKQLSLDIAAFKAKVKSLREMVKDKELLKTKVIRMAWT
jgi:hypothetical protein